MNDQSTKASSTSVRPALDFQQHLVALDAAGLLVKVDRPINKDTELHPLVRWQFIGGIPENERKAFMFTNVMDSKGRKYEMPVVVGALAASPQIYAMGMGRPVAEIGDAWLSAIAKPIAPREISSAPCQDVVLTGEDLTRTGGGLAQLPVPVSTPGFDSAPYLTATLCITKDPESGIQNMGMYRAGLKATDRLAINMGARPGGAGGWVHWLKYRKRGERMPIAIAIGAAPVVIFTSPQKLSFDIDEFSVAGGLAGVPIDTVRAKTVDLQVPANAEIVIEGSIDTSMLEPEAPFGESNGYVALEEFNMQMKVSAITHKRSPVFNAILSQVTPSESSVIKKVAYEPLFLDHLKNHLSIKGVKRVVLHEPLTNLRPVVFVQYAYGTPKTEVWRGLHGASTLIPNIGKITIAISEDVDPSSVDAVLWSMAYRCVPLEDMHIVPHRGRSQGAHFGPNATDSTLLVDATQKYPMPPLALPGREFMQNAHRIWQELGLPPVKQTPPWHGYSLGEWSDTWQRFADRTVAGDWEENGRETLARQRTGVEAQTSVKKVER